MPLRFKAEIVGALGYVILHTYLIPDIIPIVVVTDDLTAVAFAMSHVINIINTEVNTKALEKVRGFLGSTDGCDQAS